MPARLTTKQDIEVPTLYARDFAHLELRRGPLAVIYVLIDPRTGERRYVGQTHTTIIARLRMHLTSSLATHSHAASWIRSLLRLGLVPQVEILECVVVSELDDREIYWIAELRRQGCRLTNTASGGRSGNRGRKQSVEERAKRAASIKASYWASPSRQAKMRELHKHSRPPVRRGEDNNRAKLTVPTVVYIRQQMKLSSPRTTTDLGNELRLSDAAVANAGFGRTWKQVDLIESPAPSRSTRRPKATPVDIEGIWDALGRQERGCDIAEAFGISRAYVSKIKRNYTNSTVVGDPGAIKEVVT